ncbi:MAG: hypothetical protein GY804_09075 [Alphaproteobacteria bacterium]|nr:hypothetical protein [Alphaproteobacteria bacterium]
MSMLIDPTGVNPDFFVPDKRFGVHKNRQEIDLKGSYYKDSFILYLIEGTSKELLIEDLDYTITANDYDDQSTGEAIAYSPTFDKTLIKSVTILRNSQARYIISWAGQVLFKYVADSAILETDDQIRSLLRQYDHDIKGLQEVIYGNSGAGIPEKTPIKILEEDIHGTNPDNMMTNELRKIDTSMDGSCLVYPEAGCFFENTMSVINGETGLPLQKGIDYDLIKDQLELCMRSNNPSPIKTYVFFKGTLVGSILLTYHAVGGKPTIQSMIDSSRSNDAVIEYLKANLFITNETIDDAPPFSAVNTKLEDLQRVMRRLLIEKSATYGDITDGQSIVLKMIAPDNELHWYSIATLYQVDGSQTITEYDMFNIRCETAESKLMFEADIVASLYNQDGNKFRVNTRNNLLPMNYIPFDDYTSIDNKIIPMFRIVWAAMADATKTGIVLQIGFRFKEFLTDRLCIESYSGRESCWKFVAQSAEAIGPEDDLIPLPGGGTWHSTHQGTPDHECNQAVAVLPDLKGYLAFGGTQPASAMSNWTSLNNFIPEYVDVSLVKYAQVDIHDTDEDTITTSTIFFPDDVVVKLGSSHIVGDTTGRTISLKLDNRLSVTERINCKIDIAEVDETANRYIIRQVRLFF